MEDDRHQTLLLDGAEANRCSRKLLDESRTISAAFVVARDRFLERAPDYSHAVQLMVAVRGSSGGDGPLVITAITNAFLCEACIARKTGVPVKRVLEVLARLSKMVKISSEFGRCDGCLRADVLSRLWSAPRFDCSPWGRKMPREASWAIIHGKRTDGGSSARSSSGPRSSGF